MSVINRKPFIAELLNGLQSVQVTELFKCLNGKQSIVKLKLGAPGIATLKTTNHGINHVLLEVDNLRVVPGYLIWDGTKFVFISYGTGKKLGQAIIKDGTYEIEVIKEDLTIEELRRTIYDTFDVKEGGLTPEQKAVLDQLYDDGDGIGVFGNLAVEGKFNCENVPNIFSLTEADISGNAISMPGIKNGDIIVLDEDASLSLGLREEPHTFVVHDSGEDYLYAWSCDYKGYISLYFDYFDNVYCNTSIQYKGYGAKLYKHELLVETGHYITFVSNSPTPITDRYGILYNFCYPAFYSTSITAKQINYYPIKEIVFMTSSYKVKIYYGGESSSVEVSASGYTDTVTEL